MASETVPHRPKQAGLTAEQYGTVLESIAGRASTLRKLLMFIQTNEFEDGFPMDTAIDAAEALATSIGAMADGAVGGSVIGDANHWYYGPNFADARKEAQHV